MLSSLNELNLYECPIDGPAFVGLLQACSALIRLDLTRCTPLDSNSLVDGIVSHATRLKKIWLTDCFEKDEEEHFRPLEVYDRPRQIDYLSKFPDLYHIQLCPASLAADSLKFLPPAIRTITLDGKVLTSDEMARVIPFIHPSRHLHLELSNSGFDEATRTALQVGSVCGQPADLPHILQHLVEKQPNLSLRFG